MNPITKIGLGIFSILVLTLSVHAFPFTANVHGPSNVSLLEDSSVTIPIDIVNVDFHEHQVHLSVISDSGFIRAQPTLRDFEISPYQSTQIGLNITATDDADHDTYHLQLRVDMDGQVQTVPITVYVGTNPYITMTPFEKNVCADEYVESLSISVKNNTSVEKTIHLRGEQAILFPTFDEEDVIFAAGQTKIVEMKLNVSPPNVGTYKGTITADTSDIVVVRPFEVRVNDCPTPIPRTISLTLPRTPPNLVKGQTTMIPVIIKNLTDEPQGVELFVDSAIPSQNQSFTMGPRETANIRLAFTPGLTMASGLYATKVTAVASGYSISQTMNLKVLPMNLLAIEMVNNVYDITKGQSETVHLIVYNHGDSTQNVSMSVTQGLPGIDFIFVPNTFSVPAHESKVVELEIFARTDTPVTQVNTFIQAVGTVTGTAPISFSVHSPTDGLLTQLEFVSFPQFVSMGKDAQKEITFSIRNPSERAVSNVRFKLSGVKGASISVVSQAPITLMPLETKTVTVKLVTQEDTPTSVYSPVLAIQAPNAFGSTPFSLEVMDNSALGLFTGLISFVSGRAFWLGLLILLGLIAYSLVRARSTKKPVWTTKGF